MADASSPKAPTTPAQATSPLAASTPTTVPSPGRRSKTASPSTPAVPANVGVLEADDDYGDNDADSGFLTENGGESDTTSVASSIFKFREENGRTYHAYKASKAAYFMPNDERENDRLDLQHNIIIRMQDNQLYVSPAGQDKPLKRVLDAGCGTGIWAMEFADEHPETAVVGVDLSPIQPTFVAPNVEFFIDDLEAEWAYTNPFDLIFIRCLTGSIRDWPKLLAQAYKHLAPGGYIEVGDPLSPLVSDDGTVDNTAVLEWNTLLLEASVKLGAPMDTAKDAKQRLIEAGFQNVVQVEYKWPTNPWPKDAKHKELGAWVYANVAGGLSGMSLMLFTNVLGWSAAEVETFLVDVRKDLKNRNTHGYWPYYVVYGQKPE